MTNGIKIIRNKFYELNIFNGILNYIKNNLCVRLLKSIFDQYLNQQKLKENIAKTHSGLIIDQVMQMYPPKWIWSSKYLHPEIITFVSGTHSINENELLELKNEGMNFIALNRKLIRGLGVPIFLSSYSTYVKKNKSEEDSIVRHYANENLNEKKHWCELFE